MTADGDAASSDADFSDAAFSDFVATRYAALVRSAYLLTSDRGHAEDLVQSALVATYGSWDRLRAVAAAEAYTRTTMIRLAGRWRRRAWLKGNPVPARRGPHRAGIPLAWSSQANGIDLHAALARLPLQQRAVLVLRYFDDLTETQTAAILGCSVGTVKSRASRAMATLRGMGLLTADVKNHEVHND